MSLTNPNSDAASLLSGVGLESAKLDMMPNNLIEFSPRVTLPASLLSFNIDVAPFSLGLSSDDGQDLITIVVADLMLSKSVSGQGESSMNATLSPLIKITLDSVYMHQF